MVRSLTVAHLLPSPPDLRRCDPGTQPVPLRFTLWALIIGDQSKTPAIMFQCHELAGNIVPLAHFDGLIRCELSGKGLGVIGSVAIVENCLASASSLVSKLFIAFLLVLPEHPARRGFCKYPPLWRKYRKGRELLSDRISGYFRHSGH